MVGSVVAGLVAPLAAFFGLQGGGARLPAATPQRIVAFSFADGRVAAVGSGGLRNGAASISWAVPASHLDALLASREQPGARGSRSSGLFATPLSESAPDRLRCGNLEFVPIGVRSFGELSMSTDDPGGLQQLLASAGLPPPLAERFGYRIFVPLDRGAAIAIPTWMRVESHRGFCLATSPDGRLAIEFGGNRVADAFTTQNAAMEFEMQFVQRTRRIWNPDVSYSYLMSLQRFDGLTVNRKAAFANDGHGPPAWAFETLMVKGDTFVAAIAVNRYYDPQRISFCRFQPYAPGCQGILDEIATFSQAVLGVHLSTFPVY